MAHETYYAALAADQAWSAELQRLYGKRAGDMRYRLAGQGAPGTHLHNLYLAKLAADQAMRSY